MNLSSFTLHGPGAAVIIQKYVTLFAIAALAHRKLVDRPKTDQHAPKGEGNAKSATKERETTPSHL